MPLVFTDMHRTKLILAFLVIAILSFVAGNKLRLADRPPASPGRTVKPGPMGPVVVAQGEPKLSKEPPQTYRGPDGLPHLIIYDQSKPQDDQDPVQIQAAVMADMKNHPANIAGDYGIKLEEIQRIADGKADFPKALLPSKQ